MSKTVRTDSRGRVSLGTALEPDRYYLVTRNESGRVTLTPMKLVPAADERGTRLPDPRTDFHQPHPWS